MRITSLPRCLKDGDLRLRPLRISDGPSLSKMLVQKEKLKAGGGRRMRKTPWIYTYFRLRKTFFAAYCIEHRRETIGFAGLHNLVPGESAEISLIIFDSINRRRGFGTRAFLLLSGNSFTVSLADTLIARVENDNKPARFFWTSLGFTPLETGGDVTVMIRRNAPGG